MEHTHAFETVSHPKVCLEGIELGIRGAEVRRCLTCNKEVVFLMAKNGWFPLFDETAGNKEDILLA